jgi:flagellin
MGLRINTNVPSLTAQRNLRTNRSSLDKNLERLSSGSRINRAGDDAAGLAISETLRAQIRGISQAERNAQDGISMVQVAEGALTEVANLLIRMRELSVQSSSDTVGPNERRFLDVEYRQAMEEIDRIANSTEYNGVKLLNGSAPVFEVQIGTKNDPTIDRVRLFDSSATDSNAVALGINMTSAADKASAQNSLSSIDSALAQINRVRAEFGAVQNRLQSVINNIMVSRENLASANSRIRDTDLAEEVSELTKHQILMQAGVSVLSQANSALKSTLSLLGGNA